MEQQHGCVHYSRHCQLRAPCCGLYYACRRCHDESGHKMDRFAVTEMKCLYCETSQQVSNECVACHRRMARYYCDVCHLFDDDEKHHIWHCVQCGMCLCDQTGNAEPHEHCVQCNTCRAVGHTTHINSGADCPVCLDPLYSNNRAVVFPGPCTHWLHSDCFTQYLSHKNYACPVCKKTFATLDMTPLWHSYDELCRAQPTPPEYAQTIVTFLCNDCEVRQSAQQNLIGYKCIHCHGYNTVVVM